MKRFASYTVAHRDRWSGVDTDGRRVRMSFRKYGCTLRFEGPRRRFSVYAPAALHFLRETAALPPQCNRAADFRWPMINNREFERSLVRRGVLLLAIKERRRCLDLGLDLRSYEPGPKINMLIRWLERQIAKGAKT